MNGSLLARPFRYRAAGLLCLVFGHSREAFEGWFGPAGAPDEEGEKFDLAICRRCLTNLGREGRIVRVR